MRGVSAPQARFGQVTRVGTVAFHCERRERVLLRDIFLFGTATIDLLLVTRRIRQCGRSVLSGVFGIESVPQSGPARVQYLMRMTGFEIIESLAALRAQARAVRPAQRRHRQREHHLVPDQRLQVDQVVHQPGQFVVVGGGCGGRIGVGVQLADPGDDGFGQVDQAPRALPDRDRGRGPGDQHALGDRLQPQVEVHVGARRDRDHVKAHRLVDRRGQPQRAQGARASTQRPGVDHPGRVGLRAGMA